jgi:hypothetical protein
MDDTRSVTWKATLIGAAMTLATSAGGYISSHWGGVKSEQLAADKAEILAAIDVVRHEGAKSSDDLKRYVDEKITAAEARFPKPKPKKEHRAE